MNKNTELIGQVCFVPAHSYSRESLKLLADIKGDRMFLSDEEGNGEHLPIDAIELRRATVGELIDFFCDEIMPEYKPMRDEIKSDDNMMLKIAQVTEGYFKHNVRTYESF